MTYCDWIDLKNKISGDVHNVHIVHYVYTNVYIGKIFNICFILLAVTPLQHFLKELKIANTVTQL